jgi:hypothetical protein
MTHFYSEEQIKQAFWKVFHRSGEHFFSYSDEESAKDCTESSWDDFYIELETISRGRP